LLSLTLLAVGAVHAQNTSYYWRCHFNECTFAANQLPAVLSYDWQFGDGTYGSGPNQTHTYDFPGSGQQTTRVTLSYHFANGTFRNVRCYITWWETTAGGDPTDYVFEGTCDSFH
jgi:hypothetical protein